MLPDVSRYELRQMEEYERRRAEERRKRGENPSRAPEVLTILFWSVVGLIVLWHAPLIPWVGLLKLIGLMIGWAILCIVGAAILLSLVP
jgi:hypothetical protein